MSWLCGFGWKKLFPRPFSMYQTTASINIAAMPFYPINIIGSKVQNCSNWLVLCRSFNITEKILARSAIDSDILLVLTDQYKLAVYANIVIPNVSVTFSPAIAQCVISEFGWPRDSVSGWVFFPTFFYHKNHTIISWGSTMTTAVEPKGENQRQNVRQSKIPTVASKRSHTILIRINIMYCILCVSVCIWTEYTG